MLRPTQEMVDTAAEAGRLLLPVVLAGLPAALVAGFISISGIGRFSGFNPME